MKPEPLKGKLREFQTGFSPYDILSAVKWLKKELFFPEKQYSYARICKKIDQAFEDVIK